ncbi:TetR/AcrR family transcriptional regulator [Pseudonocardia endophytica]|uniref:TetR family transcriptional regulator n=1 Tax=Pseudonocardia endophytica TaxID=401976 RepID=A0A4R1I1P8_PSEEN|nr:TetR/AcrR family transcriptional regulator [Pseudonocardia endophytica]TCK27495.1 TetR family transcriptional regulator [Pseudonocardia endophytica]
MARRPIWLRPVVESTTGRPAEWSREQITDAGIAVADAEGLAAVTMRRVAAELGTGAASLYRHVSTRDDLVDLMVDRAFADLPAPPDTGDWRADVVAHNIDLLRYLRGRPWIVDGIVTRPPFGPNSVRRVEQILGLMAASPAPGSRKMEAVGVIAGMVQTTAVHERPGHGGALDEEFVAAQMTVLVGMAHDGTHPHLAAVFADPPADPGESGDERMARILRVVLDGLLPEEG